MKKSLGYKIRKIREIKNISQDYVAKHLGIGQGSYSGIESGKIKVNEKKLIRIAAALNVDIDVIKNFNEETIFNLWLSGSYDSGSNLNSLEKLQDIYEKLLKEKDSRIKLLEAMLNKEPDDLSRLCMPS